MQKINHKETINLLNISDSNSDISDFILTPKKKKLKRRQRVNGSLKITADNINYYKHSWIKSVLLWLIIIFIVTWFFILSWMAVILYKELKRLDISIKSVVAGSEGVPDALQMCHTLNKNLKTNITYITDEIQILNKSMNNFSSQILYLKQELQQLQTSLKSAPELTSVPTTVKALQDGIGQLEIDISDIQTAYKKLKDVTLNLQNAQNKQQESLTIIKDSLSRLSNVTLQPQKVSTNENIKEAEKIWQVITNLNKNLTLINETLTTNLTWAQEDFANDHKIVVSLQDMVQNASSQILTLQQECIRKKDQESLHNLLHLLSTQINNISNKKNNQEGLQADQTYETSEKSQALLISFMGLKNKNLTDKMLEQSFKQDEIIKKT